LKKSKNDIRAIKTFLLGSLLKFEEENIITLVNPTKAQLVKATDEFRKMAIKAGVSGPTNIFCYYGGHGASLDGAL
jgi:hypothetical protein